MPKKDNIKHFNKKKGFTIVELVIVVAVVGILTAVLVPTFVNLVSKANEAADNSLVTNLNKQLEIKRATEGSNKTMSEALDDCLEGGYKVDNLTPTSDGKDIIWSSVEDRFYFVDKDQAPAGAKSSNLYDYFKVYTDKDAIPATQTFSIYAKGTNWTTVPTLAVGFDAGENEGIAAIEFATSETRSVVIRTNGSGTVFTVNAPSSNVYHYDELDSLTITAVAPSSYHEYGNIANKVVISQGHIAIESGAEVPEVSVENATGAVTVTANEGTLVSADSASSSQTSVVANSEEVFVSGVEATNISGTSASEVALPTAIASEANLTAALAAGKNYLQLSADFTVTNPFVIVENSVFDFAGHRISAEHGEGALMTSRGTTTIMDTGENGGLTSSGEIVLKNSGNMTIKGGKFVGTNDWTDTEAKAKGTERGVINNASEATLFVKNVRIEVAHDFALLNNGYTTIDGGEFVSAAESYGGYAYGYAVSSYGGKLTINSADIQGVHGCIGINAGEGEINDVHAETVVGNGNSYRALYVAGERDRVNVYINGGYFKSYRMEAASIGNNSDGGLGRLATAIINGGTFINGAGSDTKPAIKIINADWSTSTNYGIGEATINGGKFSSDVTGAHGVETCVKGEDGLWVVNA